MKEPAYVTRQNLLYFVTTLLILCFATVQLRGAL